MLPFIIECLFKVGDVCPVVITNYSQSDILSYIITVIAAILALIAIVISISSKDIKLTISSAFFSDKSKSFARIMINNNGIIDCSIQYIYLMHKKSRTYDQIYTKPFEIKAKNHHCIDIDFVEFKTTIEEFNGHLLKKGYRNKKIYLSIHLATNEEIILRAKEVEKLYKEAT